MSQPGTSRPPLSTSSMTFIPKATLLPLEVNTGDSSGYRTPARQPLGNWVDYATDQDN